MLKWITPLLVSAVLVACGGAPKEPETPEGVDEVPTEEPGMEDTGMEEPGMDDTGMDEEPAIEDEAPVE